MKEKESFIVCPDCESNIYVGLSLEAGEIVFCNTCGAQILINQVKPSLEYKLKDDDEK